MDPEANFDFGTTQLSEREHNELRQIVYQRLGINLTPQKQGLIRTRLERHVRELGLSSFSEYCKYVLADTTGKAMDELANRISTNHTFFFRERNHFDYLVRDVLPPLTRRLRESGERDLRVWCAGCSTGEESYTLAMLLLEHLGMERTTWSAGLLATDISSRVLRIAAEGIYNEERMRGLPPNLRKRYFRQIGEDLWQVSDALKAEVTFRRFNLMNQSFPFRRGFHVIFCRNVMIYFDEPTRTALAERFMNVLVPGGHLFIGHSETLGRDVAGLKYLQPAVYQREEG